MSDDSFKSGYDYKSVSNLVLNVDSRSRGEIGPSSDVQSLSGRRSVHQMQREMGSRATAPSQAETKAGKERQRTRGGAEGDEVSASQSKRAKASPPDGPTSSFTSSPSSSLSTSQLYRPQTKETRLVYDSLLSFLPTVLPTLSSHDVLTSAADEVLLLLKEPNTTAKSQQAEVEALLGVKVSDERFRTLVNIAKRVTDWSAGPVKDEEADRRGGGGGKVGEGAGADVDDRVGVSVVFNEEDDEEEGGGEEEDDMDVIKDEESEEEEEVEVDDVIEEDDAAQGAVLHSKEGAVVAKEETADDDDGDVLTAATPAKAKASGTSASTFDVRSVDAHWIQRQITAFTPDAITSQSLSSRVFASMSDGQLSDGAVETSLVSLLGFDRFPLIKTLVTHRWPIVYAIRLARAGSEAEKEDVTREMRENDKAKGVEELLTGKPSAHPSNTMDVDSTPPTPALASQASQRHSDAYWTRHPRSMLDLESLAFTAGAHQMSNAECKLPKGSELFTKKNYQEVHIPALRPQPMGEGEVLVRVDSMPQWAQGAFAGMTELNRIQSRVYDTAINSVDNMLVCAPTGAGQHSTPIPPAPHAAHRTGKDEQNLHTLWKLTVLLPDCCCRVVVCAHR